MKLKVSYAYNCTPEAYWQMYWDDAFDAKLQEGSTVDREVVEEREEEGVLHRRLRFTPHAELPSPVARLIGSKKLVYDQANAWHKSDSVMTWEVLPTFISADKFAAKGTFKIVPTAGGCEMHVDGDIDVKVRFIGGKIEQEIIKNIDAAYAKMHHSALEWMTSNRGNS